MVACFGSFQVQVPVMFVSWVVLHVVTVARYRYRLIVSEPVAR